MNIEQRNAQAAFIFAECMDILKSKGSDYNPQGVAFQNITKIADELGIDPAKVLWVFFRKHLLSLESFIKTGAVKSSEPVRGRIVDAINYLALLGVMMEANAKSSDGVNLEDVVANLNPFDGGRLVPSVTVHVGETVNTDTFPIGELFDAMNEAKADKKQDLSNLANPAGPMVGPPSKTDTIYKIGKGKNQ